MSNPPRRWRPRSRLDGATLVFLAGYFLAVALGATGWRRFLAAGLVFLALFYAVRWILRAREHLLWRLNHRLLVIYFFVAVVPIFLLATMVVLTAYLLYGQLAGYLITTDLQGKARRLGSGNQVLSMTLRPLLARTASDPAPLLNLLTEARARLESDFPGVQVLLITRGERLARPREAERATCSVLPGWVGNHLEEIVLHQQRLFVHTLTRLSAGSGEILCLSAPVSPALLDTVGKGLGAFRLLLPMEGNPRASGQEPVLVLEGRRFQVSNSLTPATPAPLPPAERFDPEFTGLSMFSAVAWDAPGNERTEVPILISLTTRPSLVNRQVFGTLGAAVTVPLALLVVFGVIFVVLEGIAFITGVGLTRSITTAVSELYAATRRIQVGDFTARVHHRRRDQLGELADSFNLMAGSLERLIEESKERQRLENELEIARQVQEQLFPREAPHLTTLELVGVCQPARVVSGDYYDYGLLAPGKLVFAIGDISGKGISAALLMATIQAALRSQLYAARIRGDLQQLSPAGLVTRLNRQLYETTSSEKYASLFCAFYDEAERALTYSNAGHLAPAVLSNGRIRRLDVGGAVVGLFGDTDYQEGRVRLEPGSLLVAFTDGLTEAENAYGEEFGSERLLEVIPRNAAAAPVRLAETLLQEIRQWVATGEQVDDMTVLVARAR